MVDQINLDEIKHLIDVRSGSPKVTKQITIKDDTLGLKKKFPSSSKNDDTHLLELKKALFLQNYPTVELKDSTRPTLLKRDNHNTYYKENFWEYLNQKLSFEEFFMSINYPKAFEDLKKKDDSFKKKASFKQNALNSSRDQSKVKLKNKPGVSIDESKTEEKIINPHINTLKHYFKFKLKKRRMLKNLKPEANEQKPEEFKLLEKFDRIIQDYKKKITNGDLLSNNVAKNYYEYDDKPSMKTMSNLTIIRKLKNLQGGEKQFAWKSKYKKLYKQVSNKIPASTYSELVDDLFKKKTNTYINLLRPPTPSSKKNKPIFAVRNNSMPNLNLKLNQDSSKQNSGVLTPFNMMKKSQSNLKPIQTDRKQNSKISYASTTTTKPFNNSVSTVGSDKNFRGEIQPTMNFNKQIKYDYETIQPPKISKKVSFLGEKTSKYELPDRGDEIVHTFASKLRGNAKKLYLSDYYTMKELQLQDYIRDIGDCQEGIVRHRKIEQSSGLKNALENEQKMYLTEVNNFDPYNEKLIDEFLYENQNNIKDQNYFVCPHNLGYYRKHKCEAPPKKQEEAKSNENFRNSNLLNMHIKHNETSDDDSITSQTEAKLDLYYKISQNLQNRVTEKSGAQKKTLFTKTIKDLIKIEDISKKINNVNITKLRKF